jgi:protein-S-isoprenylcysteine O-methyltransferase Ste14
MDNEGPLFLLVCLVAYIVGGLIFVMLPVMVVSWVVGSSIWTFFGTLLFLLGAVAIYEHIKERSRLAKLDK